MFERNQNKDIIPTETDLENYCGENKERFINLNNYLKQVFATNQEIRFPYSNKYGWGITHRKGKN